MTLPNGAARICDRMGRGCLKVGPGEINKMRAEERIPAVENPVMAMTRSGFESSLSILDNHLQEIASFLQASCQVCQGLKGYKDRY